MPSVSILAVGSELLDGRVADTNSQFVAQELSDRGFSLDQVVVCDDNVAEVKRALDFLFSYSPIVIVSGGLGPTSDDLTREAVASYLGLPLVLNQAILEEIKNYFSRRNRPFDPSNSKQAEFPKTATIISNSVGSAPGFRCKIIDQDRQVFCLPGVPTEFRKMFELSVLPEIVTEFSSATKLSKRVFRIFGLPESVVGSRVKAANISPEISVSYRALFPEIQVILKNYSAEVLQPASEQISATIGPDFIFSNSLHMSFTQTVHELLDQHKKTVAVAESCTAGFLGKLLTDNPGASNFFLGGILSYTNQIKIEQLGVPTPIIDTVGAVSFECAAHMAHGCQKKFSSDFALSITGVSGPGGGSEQKPTGTFYIGLAGPVGVKAFHFLYPSNRDWVRTYAAYFALDSLRRMLLDLPFHPDCQIRDFGVLN